MYWSKIMGLMNDIIEKIKDNVKNFKSIWTKIRRKQAIDSIQNSSGKINRQAKGNWEIKLLDKGQLFNRLQCSGLGQSLSKAEQGLAKLNYYKLQKIQSKRQRIGKKM